MSGFKSYVVGGAVRDALLGLPVKDRDHVVVGATPEQMRAQGFVAVGKDFPVFLHPQTHEEYALARTERKTAPGYAGFAFHAAPDVTLEQDLQRRDLTINAIAQDEDGTLIDPCGGRADIDAKIFRHVSPAFAEDPVRILRVARFAARFTEFTVAPQTMSLMKAMVDSGEVDALVPERVWQEMSRGLMEQKPSHMFAVLRDCGALARILPELDSLADAPQPAQHRSEIDAFEHVMAVVDAAASYALPLATRFAALVRHLGNDATDPADSSAQIAHEATDTKPVEHLCARLKVQNEIRDLAIMTAREQGAIARAEAMSADGIVKLLERCDAFRKPARFAAMLDASECDYLEREGIAPQSHSQKPLLLAALAAAQSVNAGDIAAEVIAASPERASEKIAAAIHAARVLAVEAAIKNADPSR
jgi:tRNA nucleotidyltransferase (CCA-adding enzyme)